MGVTLLSEEIQLGSYVNTTGGGVITGDQYWKPQPMSLGPDRFVVAALVTTGGVNYTRNSVLNAKGQILGTLDTPYPDGNPQYVITGPATWIEISSRVSPSTTGQAQQLKINGFEIDAAGTPSLAYSKATSWDAGNVRPLILSSNLTVSNGVLLAGQYIYTYSSGGGFPTEPSAIAPFAIDVATGEGLWIDKSTLQSLYPGSQGPVNVFVDPGGGKFKMYWPAYPPGGNVRVYEREFTWDRTGATPTGDPGVLLDQPYGTTGGAGDPAAWLDPYWAPGGAQWIEFFSNYDLPWPYPMVLRLRNKEGVAAEYSGDFQSVEQWPWSVQSGLPFGHFAGRFTDIVGGATKQENGVKLFVFDPAAAEISNLYVEPHVNGAVGDPATWRYWDETSGGSINAAFDAASGVGILTVGWVAQVNDTSDETLSGHAWVVQGPSNAPNLSGKPEDGKLIFAR